MSGELPSWLRLVGKLVGIIRHPSTPTSFKLSQSPMYSMWEGFSQSMTRSAQEGGSSLFLKGHVVP